VGHFELNSAENIDAGMEWPMVPTGKGAPDVQLLLLTPCGQIAGVGELAELYVRSPHLASGYVDDEELTGANFIVNPYTNEPRDRLYRTGDFARYRPDGNVEWVGRRDRRVSVRGFRVELSEVESALSECSAVRTAAVTGDAAKSVGGLIAYIVARSAAADLPAQLRAFLGERLPHYMVPAEFVFLERLPLNPNGKIDYGQLAAMTRRDSVHGTFEPPCCAMEKKLAELFAEILGVERVGRDDNFFQLGGHSLLAAQITARIRETVGVRLDLRAFLEAPTVAALADYLESLAAAPVVDSSDREELEL
jgi:acyl carrier protein